MPFSQFIERVRSSYHRYVEQRVNVHWIFFAFALLLAAEGYFTNDLYTFLSSLGIAFLCCPIPPSQAIPTGYRYFTMIVLLIFQF